MEEFDFNGFDNNDNNNNNIKNSGRNILIGFACCVMIAAFVLLFVTLSDCNDNSYVSPSSYLTYSNYIKIQNGMTYSQVVEILGNDPGECTTESGYGGYTLSYYTWTNYSGTKCIVIGFENGKVCTKSQYGLN